MARWPSCLIAVSCLSYLTWRYIETPNQTRPRLDRRGVVGGALAGIACLGFGKAMVTSHGFPERLSANTLAILASVKRNSFLYYQSLPSQ